MLNNYVIYITASCWISNCIYHIHWHMYVLKYVLTEIFIVINYWNVYLLLLIIGIWIYSVFINNW